MSEACCVSVICTAVSTVSIYFDCVTSDSAVRCFVAHRYRLCPQTTRLVGMSAKWPQRHGDTGFLLLQEGWEWGRSYLILTSSFCLLWGTPSRLSCEGESGQEILHSPILWNPNVSHNVQTIQSLSQLNPDQNLTLFQFSSFSLFSHIKHTRLQTNLFHLGFPP